MRATSVACGRPTKREHITLLDALSSHPEIHSRSSKIFDQLLPPKTLFGASRPSFLLPSSPFTKASLRSCRHQATTQPQNTITMARKKRPVKAGGTYCTFPSLHSDVSTLLEEDDLHFGFRDDDDPTSAIKWYDTNIMGRFVCRNVACSCTGWWSMKIAITIRMSVQVLSSHSPPPRPLARVGSFQLRVTLGQVSYSNSLLTRTHPQVSRRRVQRSSLQAALPALQLAR